MSRLAKKHHAQKFRWEAARQVQREVKNLMQVACEPGMNRPHRQPAPYRFNAASERIILCRFGLDPTRED